MRIHQKSRGGGGGGVISLLKLQQSNPFTTFNEALKYGS